MTGMGTRPVLAQRGSARTCLIQTRMGVRADPVPAVAVVGAEIACSETASWFSATRPVSL